MGLCIQLYFSFNFSTLYITSYHFFIFTYFLLTYHCICICVNLPLSKPLTSNVCIYLTVPVSHSHMVIVYLSIYAFILLPLCTIFYLNSYFRSITSVHSYLHLFHIYLFIAVFLLLSNSIHLSLFTFIKIGSYRSLCNLVYILFYFYLSVAVWFY